MKRKLFFGLFAFIMTANIGKAQVKASENLSEPNPYVGKLISVVVFLEAQETFAKAKNKAEALKDLEEPLKNSPIRDIIFSFMGGLYDKSKVANNPDYIYYKSSGKEILPAIVQVMRGKLLKIKCCPRPILAKMFFPGINFDTPPTADKKDWKWWLNAARKFLDFLDDLVNKAS